MVLVTALSGCVTWGTPPVRARSNITPLTETEFDRFAERICERMRETIAAEGYALPVAITPPIVDLSSIEGRTIVTAFARRLAAGVSDRLHGAVRFARPAANEPGLRARLSFAEAAPDVAGSASGASGAGGAGGGTRVISFALIDADAGRDLFVESFDYTVRLQAAPVRVRGSGRIEIDHSAADLGPYIRARAEAYRGQSALAADGRVIFLDRQAAQRFEILAQRTRRTDAGRLRVEFDVRTRESERNALLRVVFFDERDRQVGATVPTPYRFQPFDAKIVAFTSRSEKATWYVCLFESE